MTRRWGRAVLAFGAMAALLHPCTGRAGAPQIALVIGNGTYASLPVLSPCTLSAHAVSAALGRIGFDVVETEDASGGDFGAALGAFGRKLAAAPGASAVVYVCGYAGAYDGRAFLLPVSAAITRPSDALTQGVLAKSLVSVTARGQPAAAVVVLDVVPMPGMAPQALGLETLAQDAWPPGLGLVAATEGALPATGTTPLAATLIDGLAGPAVQSGPLVERLSSQGAQTQGMAIAALRAPETSGYLAGAPAPAARAARSAPAALPPLSHPAAPQSAEVPPPPPLPSSPPQLQPPPLAPPSRPGGAVQREVLPAEAQMSEAQRRAVQIALATLGYYDGRIDGVFGPDTRAAIRRYQHELHADMTGVLTTEQATRLVSRNAG